MNCSRVVDLSAASLPDELELVEGRIHPGARSGVSVVGGETAPRLRLRDTFDSAEVQGLWIELSGTRRGLIEVERVPRDGREPPRLTSIRPEVSASPRSRYLFDWRSEPLDSPFRIQIRPTTVAGEIVTLERICLSRDVQSVRDLAQLESTPWKITLDGETRDSFVLASGGRADRFHVGPKSRFSFGLGLASGSGGNLSVTVTARAEGGTRVDLLAEPWNVDDRSPTWRDFSVDLSPLLPGDYLLETRVRGGDEDDRWFAYSAPQVRSVAGGGRLPDIVLIVIDTLRADHVSSYGYERPTTPQLDDWARNSATLFERTVAPAGWTLPSHFSLFTGLDAFRHSANYYRGSFDATSYRFLASELWRRGYQTGAFTGGSFVSPDFGLARGFESFRSWKSGFGSGDELPVHLEAAESWIDRAGGSPFFLFLHTYEVHTPNPARQPFFSRFSSLPPDYSVQLATDPPNVETGFEGSLHAVLDREGERVDPIPPALAALPTDAYDSAIAYVDAQLGPLLRRLTAPGVTRRPTIVAVTADHGESLAVDRAGHGYLTPDNLEIPLLLSVPGRRGGHRIGAQVRLIDLYSTLLELAGAPVPAEVDARSLLPLLDSPSPAGRVAYSYAASMNYGLAKIDTEGSMVSWRNSPWRPFAGSWGVDRLYGTSTAAPPGSAERAVRELQHLYVRSVPGLRCEISTSSRLPVRVDISSDLVDPVATKSPAPPQPGLTWLAIGQLQAEISASNPLQLVFERLVRPEVGLEVTVQRPSACPSSASKTLGGPLEALREGVRYAISLPTCARAASAGAVEIRLQLQGAVPSEPITAGNKELARELRALGYLE